MSATAYVLACWPDLVQDHSGWTRTVSNVVKPDRFGWPDGFDSLCRMCVGHPLWNSSCSTDVMVCKHGLIQFDTVWQLFSIVLFDTVVCVKQPPKKLLDTRSTQAVSNQPDLTTFDAVLVQPDWFCLFLVPLTRLTHFIYTLVYIDSTCFLWNHIFILEYISRINFLYGLFLLEYVEFSLYIVTTFCIK